MQWMTALLRVTGEFIGLLIAAPILTVAAALSLAVNDLIAALTGLRQDEQPAPDEKVDAAAVSVVIPTWNGREHLECNLPYLVAALAGNPEHEILVVDNGSTDGTLEILSRRFPKVRVLALETNLGFGGGSNAGFRAARHDIVVLLNNDMRVEADFLAPMLEGFRDPRVFAVSSQIFFTDPAKRREETGLTQASLAQRTPLGRPHHRREGPRPVSDVLRGRRLLGLRPPKVSRPWRLRPPLGNPFISKTPTSATTPGSTAGWCSTSREASSITTIAAQSESTSRQPLSGTPSKRTTCSSAGKTSMIGDCSAPISPWLYAGLWIRLLGGEETGRPDTAALWKGLPPITVRALHRRNRARRLAVVDDREAFRRPLGGYLPRPVSATRPRARQAERPYLCRPIR